MPRCPASEACGKPLPRVRPTLASHAPCSVPLYGMPDTPAAASETTLTPAQDPARSRSSETPARRYRERATRFEEAAANLASRSRRVGSVRIAVFALIIVTGLWFERTGGPLPLAVVLVTLAAFTALVIAHRRIRAAEAWQHALAGANRLGLARLARDWSQLPYGQSGPGNHPYARDIDVFGPASIRQILGATASVHGENVLCAWLLDPAPANEIPARQAAIRDLAGRNDLRDGITARALLEGGRLSRRAIEDVLAWAESEPWMTTMRWPLPVAGVLTAVTWLLIALNVLGFVPATAWLVSLLVNYGFTVAFYKRIHRTYDVAFARESVLERLPPLLALLEAEPYEAPLLRELHRRLNASGAPPHRELQRLVRLMELSDVRRSSYTYLPVQVFTLWDFHLLASLERWQLRAGRRMRAWLEAASQIEALAALSTLAHDQPSWCFPDVERAADTLDARELGHPLLADAVRVGNDVSVGPPGTFLLVTGSNMSGKSTLLRAIGVNAVLAQCGAPVCAGSLRMPPLSVWTSVRIDDSLAEGVSLFMAELKRMKEIVDAADASSRDATTPRPIFLLDEILHGTNTAERRIAARRVIRHLIERGAIGAVTTHDLALAEDEQIAGAAVPVHFTETVHGQDATSPMTFDYRLRPGLATSTNALRLMQLIGIGTREDIGAESGAGGGTAGDPDGSRSVPPGP
jgi:hypothetical protein